MPIGDIYQLGVNQQVNGVNAANIYTYEQLSDVTPGNAPEASLMQAWLETMTPLQQAFSSDKWANVCLTCRKVRPTGGVQFIVTDTTVGLIPDETFAANTGTLIGKYGSPASRRGRGTNIIPGMGLSLADGGRLNSSGIALFATFTDRLMQSISWTTDNADFILRIISTLDTVIRQIDQITTRVRQSKLASRQQQIC